MSSIREHTWGDDLVVETFHFAGGLQRAVKVIHAVVGPYVGVRNTFARLLRAQSPAVLDERDYFRAWLLLTVYGLSPDDWGIGDEVVPAIFDPAQLRSSLHAHAGGDPGPEVTVPLAGSKLRVRRDEGRELARTA